MSATIDTWTGRVGLLAGALLVVSWLAFTGRPGAAPDPTASIRLGALASGELEISPLGKPILATGALRANGHPQRGTLRVRNQTPRRLDFALRTTATERDLDEAAWIEVSDGSATLVHAPLRQVRRWSARNLSLASGEGRRLDVRVWIPKDAPDTWQAGRSNLTLEFSSNPEDGR